MKVYVFFEVLFFENTMNVDSVEICGRISKQDEIGTNFADLVFI